MSNPNDRSKSSPDGRSNPTPNAPPRGALDPVAAKRAAEDAAKRDATGDAHGESVKAPAADHPAPSGK